MRYGREPIEKCCPVCGKYYMDRSTNYSKYACSMDCRMEYFYVNAPEKLFNKKIRMRINALKHLGVIITGEELIEIKEKLKKGICDICGKQFSFYRLDIDHDHITNKYRGVLCDNCNHALGYVNDDKANLTAMINYLSVHQIG